MPGQLIIIWDYESALGQINSTLPYNFSYAPIYREINNVEYILSKANKLDIKMTFACMGFAAEVGVYPFNNQEQIRKIFEEGHEIASHSWRHEWLPYLTEKQIFKTLERSKFALESCLGKKGVVKGFALPHSRPMSWYKKYSFSLGDRGFYPFHRGADLGYILKQLAILDYGWCRVLNRHRPIWEKAFGKEQGDDYRFGKWEVCHDIVCVPAQYTGFDKPALEYLKKAVEKNESLVIVGHPAQLSKDNSESKANFDKFIDAAHKYISEGKLEAKKVSERVIEIFPDRSKE